MRVYLSFSSSVFLHVLILLLIIYINKKNNTYIETDNIINISSVVSVEAIGLPNVLKKDIEQISQIKTQELSKDDMVLNQDNNDAVLKLKAINSLKEKIKQDDYLSKIKQIKGMGRVFTDGTPISLTGSNTNENGEENVYILKIQKLVSMNWELPTWADLKNKKVLINCTINSDGSIKNIVVTESSGINEIDETAINAIKKSAPFPEPPYKFKEILETEGLNFSFP